MRRLAIPLIAAFLLLAPPAEAKPPTMAQFNALKRQVTTLKRQVRELNFFVTCLTYAVAPMSSYGDGQNGTFGFLYSEDTTLTRTFLTSSLDFTAQGEVPDVWVAAVNPACLNQSTARAGVAFRVVRPSLAAKRVEQ